MKIRKAVIPAAGHGTRFLPVTKAMPKEMLAVIDAPAIQYVAKEAADSGVEEILIVINRSKELIRRYFEPDAATCPAERELAELISRVKFRFAYQDEATGTANAVMLAREFTGEEPFAVMYGDDVILNDGGDPCVKQLADAYARTGKSIVGVQERSPEEAAKYAVVKRGRTDGRLTELLDLVEKPSPDKMPSTLSSLGRYVLTQHRDGSPPLRRQARRLSEGTARGTLNGQNNKIKCQKQPINGCFCVLCRTGMVNQTVMVRHAAPCAYRSRPASRGKRAGKRGIREGRRCAGTFLCSLRQRLRGRGRGIPS